MVVGAKKGRTDLIVCVCVFKGGCEMGRMGENVVIHLHLFWFFFGGI